MANNEATSLSTRGSEPESHELKGFQKFKTSLANLMTAEVVLGLASIFKFSSVEVNKSRIGGCTFLDAVVTYLEKSGYISATDISPLLAALDSLNLYDVKVDVKKSFDSAGTSQMLDPITKKEGSIDEKNDSGAETLQKGSSKKDKKTVDTTEPSYLNFKKGFLLQGFSPPKKSKSLPKAEPAEETKEIVAFTRENAFVDTYSLEVQSEEIFYLLFRRFGIGKIPEFQKPSMSFSERKRKIREYTHGKASRMHQASATKAERDDGKETKAVGYLCMKPRAINLSKEDWSKFKRDLAILLPTQMLIPLAKQFGISQVLMEKLQGELDPAFLIQLMEDRGTISSSNIDKLLCALTSLRQDDIRVKVENLRVAKLSQEEAQFETFVKILRETYEEQTTSTIPVPMVKSAFKNIGQLFVRNRMEKLVQTSAGPEGDKWEQVESYYDIFTSNVKRIVLHGDPGYGKTTITIEFVREWCSVTQLSPLQEFDVLIFLRLREIDMMASFSNTILRHLCKFGKHIVTEKDIEGFLNRVAERLCILFDGLDEISLVDEDSDIGRIISGKTFKDAKVVTTTRPTNSNQKLLQNSTTYRLSGFDECMQEEYIKKLGSTDATPLDVNAIMSSIRANSFLADLLQVPLFFVLFAHNLQHDPCLQRLCSVTDYVSFLMKRFHGHDDQNWKLTDKDSTASIARIAYDGLTRKEFTLAWDLNKFLSTVSKSHYESCLSAGILIEEETSKIVSKRMMTVLEEHSHGRTVKFVHKTFQEYYAATHLIKLIKQSESSSADEKILKTLRHGDHKYVFRFACGMSKKVAEVIIEYLVGQQCGSRPSDMVQKLWNEELAMLCLLEVGKIAPTYLDVVKKICSNKIFIFPFDDRLLQRVKIDVIQTACENQIIVHQVFLLDVITSINPYEGEFHLRPGLVLKDLKTLISLIICGNSRLSSQDVLDIFEVVRLRCPLLRHLGFFQCILPDRIPEANWVDDFKAMQLQVTMTIHHCLPSYTLDIQTGKWNMESLEDYNAKLENILHITAELQKDEDDKKKGLKS